MDIKRILKGERKCDPYGCLSLGVGEPPMKNHWHGHATEPPKLGGERTWAEGLFDRQEDRTGCFLSLIKSGGRFRWYQIFFQSLKHLPLLFFYSFFLICSIVYIWKNRFIDLSNSIKPDNRLGFLCDRTPGWVRWWSKFEKNAIGM